MGVQRFVHFNGISPIPQAGLKLIFVRRNHLLKTLVFLDLVKQQFSLAQFFRVIDRLKSIKAIELTKVAGIGSVIFFDPAVDPRIDVWITNNKLIHILVEQTGRPVRLVALFNDQVSLAGVNAR